MGDSGIGSSVISSSPVPYILGTREETDAVLSGQRRIDIHFYNQFGEVSHQYNFQPLATGARLVVAHVRSMVENGSPGVGRYIEENIEMLRAFGELADDIRKADLGSALSILSSYERFRPHASVDVDLNGNVLRGISVGVPDGYRFNPVSAAAVLREAMGSSVEGRRNEFIFGLRWPYDSKESKPFTVVQYVPRRKGWKKGGTLQLGISGTDVRTQSDSSIIVGPGFSQSLKVLDDILRAA